MVVSLLPFIPFLLSLPFPRERREGKGGRVMRENRRSILSKEKSNYPYVFPLMCVCMCA